MSASQQDWLKRVYVDQMRSGKPTPTPTGHLKRVSQNLLCGWITEAWEAIPEDLVVGALKKCSISSTVNGMDDDAIWNVVSDKCASAEDHDNSYTS